MFASMEEKELRASRAAELFLKGYNCCQSVVLAFADIIYEKSGVNEAQLEAVASGFGGGIARIREVCGCVTGMTMVAGLLNPAPAAESGDKTGMDARHANYALVQSLAAKFREAQGSIVCRELLQLRSGAPDSPRPSERTPEYYKSRPCAALVACAAGILAETL